MIVSDRIADGCDEGEGDDDIAKIFMMISRVYINLLE